MSYYIYKHLDKNNKTIYIGQTINMESRQSAHKNSSEWRCNIHKIEYAEVTDNLLMDIYERYYISKYNPMNNKEYIDCQYDRFFTNLEELNFKEYKQIKTKTRNIKEIKLNFTEAFEKYYKDVAEKIENFKREFLISGEIINDYAFIENYIDCNFKIRFNKVFDNMTLYRTGNDKHGYCVNPLSSINLNQFNHLKTPEQLNYKSLDEMWGEIFLTNWEKDLKFPLDNPHIPC